jgi:asparagine synthase (glutamine-hydrolysing)
MPLKARRTLGKAIAAVPVQAWDRIVGLAPTAISPSFPGDKAHKLAARLRDVKSPDDLYRSLVSEWPGDHIVIGLDREPVSMLDDPLPNILDDDPLARMMAQDMRSYLPDDILCKVDRAAMAVSLETRVPFLDPEVLMVAARLPPSMKIRGPQGKWALRQVLSRHVPLRLTDRPKSGFGIPLGDWLRGPLRPWAEELLSHTALERDGLIDPAPVTKAWAEHLSGRRDWTHRLWIILMLQAWREHMA